MVLARETLIYRSKASSRPVRTAHPAAAWSVARLISVTQPILPQRAVLGTFTSSRSAQPWRSMKSTEAEMGTGPQ